MKKEEKNVSYFGSSHNLGGYMDFVWDVLNITAVITNIIFYVCVSLVCRKYLVGETDL